ncbi:MAG: rhodanese-like domain-containing protein [Verrucomicrobiota bacterium]
MQFKESIKQVILIVAVAAVAALVTFFVHTKAPALHEVTVLNEDEVSLAEVRQWTGEVIWIDARTEADYTKGHVQGALLLNQENWADLLWQHREVIEAIEESPVVVYCDGTTCRRSSEIAERLRTELGLEQVYVLKGDWQE